MPETPAETYAKLLRRAEEDPAVLAFWLFGSRGVGRATEHSDYDCFFVVAEDAYDAFRAELGLDAPFQAEWRSGFDLKVMTFPMLQAHAAWDSDERWIRYTFAHLKALVDKTGCAQPLIDSKACVPAQAVAPFVAASLDHALNQLYRALKCDRDGLPEASRLEAGQGVTPFIDALFALNGGRLRPYYKYLLWELTDYPLTICPFSAEALIERLVGVLAPGGAFALQDLMIATAPLFRGAGYGQTYDAWGASLDFILSYRPGSASGT
jgi:hypothetical protein